MSVTIKLLITKYSTYNSIHLLVATIEAYYLVIFIVCSYLAYLLLITSVATMGTTTCDNSWRMGITILVWLTTTWTITILRIV